MPRSSAVPAKSPGVPKGKADPKVIPKKKGKKTPLDPITIETIRQWHEHLSVSASLRIRNPGGGKVVFATGMSLSPGRSGNSLKVAYVAKAHAGGQIQSVDLSVSTIPRGKEGVSLIVLDPNTAPVAAWSNPALDAQGTTGTYPQPNPLPGALIAELDATLWTAYKMEVISIAANGDEVLETVWAKLPPLV